MSFLGGFGDILGGVLGSVGGAALGGLGGDLLGGAADVGIGSTIGGALGGGIGTALGGSKSIGTDLLGALGGASLGPGVDNLLGLGPLLGLPQGFGGGLFNLFGNQAAGTPGGAGAAGGQSGGAANGGLGASALPAGTPGGVGGSSTPGSGGWEKWLLPALGLGGVALLGNKPVAGEASMQGIAGQEGQLNNLINSLNTGALPPGAQQLVTNSLNDTITGIQSKYASLGMSNSTSEQQEISAAQERAAATTYQLATQATSTGLQAAGLQEQIYGQIAGIQLQQDQQLQQAIADFAAAAGGGGGMSLGKGGYYIPPTG